MPTDRDGWPSRVRHDSGYGNDRPRQLPWRTIGRVLVDALSLLSQSGLAAGNLFLQAGLNAIVAGFYPTAIRSTGLGWALAVGRIGSVVGPWLAGVLLTNAWTPRQIFLAGAVPATCGALAIVLASIGGEPVRGLAEEQ
jgi:MFS family permease